MILTLDVESTTSNKGNPYDLKNKLVCISWNIDGASYAERWSEDLGLRIQTLIEEAELVLFFNAKFDITWLRKYGIHLSHKRIFDCQLAEFLLRNQIGSYPSLDGCCEAHGLPKKYDVVKNEYWDKGIDTDQIPWNVLSEYAKQDVHLTHLLYQAQLTLLSPPKRRLLSLQCQDTHILQEMEWNGLKYDSNLCEERASELSKKIQIIQAELASIYPDVPINFNSSHQLSAFLYGGVIREVVKERVGVFKSGLKIGEPKYKNVEIEHQLPRMYSPLRGSEMATEGVFSTNEDTLKKLKGNRKRVELLLELAKMSKLNETYFIGLPKLNAEKNWEPEMLHGQLNQCVAVTGRLSSSSPNTQNFASELQDIFVTRY